MQDYKKYLEQDFVIFNSSLGLRDFAFIERFEKKQNTTIAYLDVPYEMVCFDLDELILSGQISFEQCIVYTEDKWNNDQLKIMQESFVRQSLFQQQFQKEIENHNRRKQYQSNEIKQLLKSHRELLCLPLEGKLEESQIKRAFKIVARKSHPDVGGSHEKFIQLTNARDDLLCSI